MRSADEQLLEGWLHFGAGSRGLSPSTVKHYRVSVRQFLNWLEAENLELATVQLVDMQRYTGEVLVRSGVSIRHRAVVTSALRGFCQWLVHTRQLRESPADLLMQPRRPRDLPMPIPMHHAEAMLNAPDLGTFAGVRDSAILHLLVGCGPRRSGISALNEEDLLFERDEHGAEVLTIRLTEKGKHPRYVPAPEETRLMLQAYLGHEELANYDRTVAPGTTVLFVNMRRRTVATCAEDYRLTDSGVNVIVKRYAAMCNVPDRFAHAHAFRHLYGQELAEHTEDLSVRSTLMGHADPKTTKLYDHVAARKLRRAAQGGSAFNRMTTRSTELRQALEAGRR